MKQINILSSISKMFSVQTYWATSIKSLLALFGSLTLISCSNAVTLEELGEMSPAERMGLTTLNLKVELPSDSELEIWKLLDGCINLKELIIDDSFEGSLSGKHGGKKPAHLEKVIANGVTSIGYSCFYASDDAFQDLQYVEFKNLIVMGNHAFGGGYYKNKITTLDFPELLGIGDELKGCANLKELKLGYHGPINFYTSFARSLNTENIDLYIGAWEYTHHVEGNLFYPHLYRNEETGDFSIGAYQDIENPVSAGGPIVFKSIHLYDK